MPAVESEIFFSELMIIVNSDPEDVNKIIPLKKLLAAAKINSIIIAIKKEIILLFAVEV